MHKSPLQSKKKEGSKQRWIQQAQVSKLFKWEYKNLIKRNKTKNTNQKETGLQKSKERRKRKIKLIE